MESIKLLVNNVQTKVTPQEDKDSDLSGHNIQLVVVDNIRNNLQLAEVKKVVVEKHVVSRESTPKKKKTRAIEYMEENVNNNSNDTEVPLNKKSNEILTRKKAQVVA